MNERAKIMLGGIVVSAIAVWGLGGFVAWDWNMAAWSNSDRGWATFFFGLGGIVTALCAAEA